MVGSEGCIDAFQRDDGLVVDASGLGFRVSGFGFRVEGLGFRVKGLEFRIWPAESTTVNSSLSPSSTQP